MTHELKRPLRFNVQPTKKPTIGIINQRELVEIERRTELHFDSGFEDDSRGSRGAPNQTPPVALPLVRSPRREKLPYSPSPSKTPQYFRWQRPAPPPPKATSKPMAPKAGPSAPSPRAQGRGSKGGEGVRPPSLATLTPSRNLTLSRSVDPASHTLFSDDLDDPMCLQDPQEPSAWQQPSLFDYPDPLSMPTTPRAASSTFLGDVSPPGSALQSARSDYEGKKPVGLFETSSSQRAAVTTSEPTTAVAPTVSSLDKLCKGGSVDDTAEKQQRIVSPESPSKSPSSFQQLQPHDKLHEPVDAPEHEHGQDRAPSPVHEEESLSTTESALDAAASPLVLKMTQNRPPQDKVIAQHVLGGKFLRKYLHASSIARKLKETEQLLRSSALHVGASGRLAQLKANPVLLSNSSARGGSQLDELGEAECETVVTGKSVQEIRRMASIDKAINKTVKRIHRVSGMADPADAAKQASIAPATHLKAKYESLRAISENQPVKGGDKGSKREPENEGSSEVDGRHGLGSEDVKLDPSSAHLLRICQHVMAKRAIKSFLHQEMSVIHQVEVSLRDDESMQRHRATSPSAGVRPMSNQTSGRRSSVGVVSPNGDGRHPITAMSAELVEAVSMYLEEGDQQMTVDELFCAALDAEKQKLWKRAILLTSACIVIDRELIQCVLLRARCCRRIGLWTQAIKDLAHALLLRPEEHRLLLLRASLFVRMSDLENALADVNRALNLHPKSTDALLLRADIFHRQRNIGSSLQDLTTALNFDPSCWRAYYDRATIRIRAIEGDEQSLSYHWEHMTYEQLLVSIIDDYVGSLRKGCKMVEVVETVGDLAVRLMEFTGDANVLRQVVHNLAQLIQMLSNDRRGSSFYMSSRTTSLEKQGTEDSPPTAMEKELLIAALHAQRGRLFVLLHDRANAVIEFDHAVVSEYHYPVAHFYRGAFATLLSKDDEASKTNVQHLTRSIALDPTIAGAYTVRGALFLRDLKFHNALQDFKAAVATDPTLYEVWLQIALIYLNHYHDSDACIRACTSALTNDSCFARALYLRGEAYTRQGNTAAALKDYGRLTIAQPDDRWAQLMRGRLLLHMKLARPALYSFILFMEQRSAGGDKRAHFLCGMAFKILSRFRKAVDAFQRAVHLNPTSENLVLLSESLHSMGDTENSLRVSEKVIHADPGSFKGYVRRAQLLVSVGQFQQAMSEYDKALFLAPKEGRVYYERGIVQMQLYMRWRIAWQLNFDKATAATTHSKKKKKKPSPFHPPLAATDVELVLGAGAMNDEPTVRKMMQSCYAGSISDFSKCIRLEPLLADPYVDRAELYALGEDYDKAFRDFESAIERNPKFVRAYVNLGVLKCQFAAFAAAVDDFDKAIKHDAKKLPLVFFNRGVAYHKLSLWSQAEKSYDQCIALSGHGRNVDAHRNRAITRCQLGDFEGALHDFHEVRQCAPDDDQLHGGLGYVLLQLDRYEDAAKSFASYGRLSRDTFGDSGNAYFNLATQSQFSLDRATHKKYLTTALRFYLHAARIQPSNDDVRLNIANCLRKQHEYARAITQCDTINSIKPTHHASLESKAFVLYQMHRLQDAIDCMSAAIRACVASSSSLENIFHAFSSDSIRRNALERKTVTSREGGARQSQQVSLATPVSNLQVTAASKDAAAVAGTDAAEKEKSDRLVPPASEIIISGSSKQLLALYMMNRGIMYEKMGNFDLARQDYSDAIHLDALSVNAYICMGTLDLLASRYEESVANFGKALAVEPNSAVAHINMGVAFMCVNNLADALPHFDAAIALVPTCSYGYANKAVALARRGDLALAEHNFKRAIEELPSRKEFYLARGKIIAQQKRLQDAMVDFSTALFLGYEGKL